jgi:hypothetical protein
MCSVSMYVLYIHVFCTYEYGIAVRIFIIPFRVKGLGKKSQYHCPFLCIYIYFRILGRLSCSTRHITYNANYILHFDQIRSFLGMFIFLFTFSHAISCHRGFISMRMCKNLD